MAEWKKVIVSGSSAELANVKNSGIAQHAAVIGGGEAGNQSGVALGAGQLLIGAAGGAPSAANLTTNGSAEHSSGSLSITNGANSIELSVANNTVGIGNLSASNSATAGHIVKVSDDGHHFKFEAASSTLTAGLGITINGTQISSSIANSENTNNPGNSFGTAGTTEFTGSFTGSLVGLADNATNATNATNVNLSDNEDTDEDNVLVFGAGASATGNTALETDGDLTYNPGKGRLSVPNITSSAGFKGDLTGNVTGNLTGTVLTAAQGNITSVGTLTSLDVSGNVTLGDAASDTVTIAGDLVVQGNTTEVQTTNLNVEDQLILLNSGSTSAKATGIIFGGSTSTGNAAGANQGAVFFHDNTTKRLSYASGSVLAGVTTLVANAHIPIVTTGSLTSIDQIGNFKVDSSGDLFVYAG